jgi:Tat protein secretion system quality control protein TatD with DNase activity
VSPDIGIIQNADEIAKIVPINRLLCETDGPDAVAWAQNTKISNRHLSPASIIDVYDMLAKVLFIEKQQLYDTVRQNVLNFFRDFKHVKFP